MTAVSHVGIVVPVHQEEELLEACLSSLADAVAAVAVRTEVVVVLDACTDRSAQIAAGFPFATIRTRARNVGAARRRGVSHVVARLGPGDARRRWIALTDADSTVPVNWITHQLILAAEGADIMIGGVRPDLDALRPAHAELWLRTHIPGRPNGHVHGANLGIRASTYRAAGGFAALPEHEDVDLVARATAAGAVVVASDGCTVATSARFVGRTPGGYAGFLRTVDADLSRQSAPVAGAAS